MVVEINSAMELVSSLLRKDSRRQVQPNSDSKLTLSERKTIQPLPSKIISHQAFY